MQGLGRKLALIGPMGSGKSALSRKLTAKYGCTALDTDAEFVKRFGPIPDFFASYGEAAFREKEQILLTEAASSDVDVVATGGGAVKNKRGMNALRAYRDIVYLSAPIDVLKRRIEKSDRPLKADLEKVTAERAPLYEKYADYHIDTSVDSLAELEIALKNKRRRRYDAVLCDSDDTLLDFAKACETAVGAALHDLGVDMDGAAAYKIFRPITDSVWLRHERGEITRQQLFNERVRQFSEQIGKTLSPEEFNVAYRKHLRDTRFLREGAIEFLQSLHTLGLKIYVITNADSYCASQRLKPILPYVDGTFISEDMGYSKPDKRFFDVVIAATDIERSRTIVFGDGENSDIKGGEMSGIDTCLYAPNGVSATAADYTVNDYSGLLSLI